MMTEPKRLLLVLAPLVPAAAVLAAPLPLAQAPHRALAVAVFMVVGWLMEPIHPALFGLAGCVLFWSFVGMDFESAFHGFLTVTPWFVYGAIILGTAADDTALARRVAGLLPRAIAESRAWATLALIVLGYLFGLLLPSSIASALILTLLAIGLARRGENDGGAGPAGYWMIVAASYAAAIFGRSAVSGKAGAAELPWIIAAAGACWLIARWLGARPAPPEQAGEAWKLPPLSLSLSSFMAPALGKEAWKAGALLAAATGFWLTASLHGVSPAIVGLGAGLIACVPGIGPELSERAQKPDPLAIIVAGTALTLPAVLLKTGSLEMLQAELVAIARAAAPFVPAKLVFYWSAVGYHLFVPETANESSQWVGQLAQASGLAGTGGAIWEAASSVKLALYQSPALILAASLGCFRGRDVLKIGLAVALAASLAALLLPA